jgi:hypothetical protein
LSGNHFKLPDKKYFKVCPRNSSPAQIPLQIIYGSIRDKIYEVRGVKVMLDFELAEIYGYSTKAFNQQVKNSKV